MATLEELAGMSPEQQEALKANLERVLKAKPERELTPERKRSRTVTPNTTPNASAPPPGPAPATPTAKLAEHLEATMTIGGAPLFGPQRDPDGSGIRRRQKPCRDEC